MKRTSYFVSTLCVFALLLGLDQWTKEWAKESLMDGPEQITSFFSLYLTYNEGVAFSLPVSSVIVLILTVVVIGFCVYQLTRIVSKNIEYWALLLISVGALGNGIDRVIQGKVTDFLSFGSFPIFNIADICITVGVGLYILSELRHKKTS